jgi:acylphosphatase
MLADQQEDHRKLIEEKTKLTIPEGLAVKLERLTLQDGGDTPRWWYKYRFEPVGRTKADIDATALLKELRKGRKAPKSFYVGEDATFVLVWSDWQVGKSEGGGTEAFIERFEAAITHAEARIKELQKIGRNMGRLVIFGNGDLVEGCTIYGNQSWHLDCDMRTQMNVAVAAALEGLDRLAPLFDEVIIMAVGGNHGENRLEGRKVNNHDNRDVELFEHVARTAARDPRLEHVQFNIALDDLAKTVDLHGWIYAITHGQVFAFGSGSVEQKAYRWYSSQAAGHLPAGDAHVLITSHYHHEASQNWGACLWVQSGHLDGGSRHFSEGHGHIARPGMLSFVVTPDCRLQDRQVL